MRHSSAFNNYAASRRLLGIFYVGTIVVFSLVALTTNMAVQLLGKTDPSTGEWFKNVLVCTFAFEFASLVFDIAGFGIEKRFNRSTEPLRVYLWKWCRATFKHALLMLSLVFVLTAAFRIGSYFGLALAVILFSVLLISKQVEVARYLSDLEFDEPSQEMRATFLQNRPGTIGLVLARNTEFGFTGGIVGLPHAESLVIPQSWLYKLTSQELWAEITRRNAAVTCGSRNRGVYGAITFTTIGVLLSAFLTEHLLGQSPSTSAGIVNLSLVFTLWSFMGLLLLPFLSQRGVIEVDQKAMAKGVSKDLLRQTAEKIDAQMEDEKERSDTVQFIFHPIPTTKRRMSYVEHGTMSGAWQVARYAVYLSIVGLGLLGRAVHCNAGKFELWSMLPAD